MPLVESSQKQNVYMAKLVEQVERYEEMVEFMDAVVETIDRTLYIIGECVDREEKGTQQEVVDGMEKCIISTTSQCNIRRPRGYGRQQSP